MQLGNSLALLCVVAAFTYLIPGGPVLEPTASTRGLLEVVFLGLSLPLAWSKGGPLAIRLLLRERLFILIGAYTIWASFSAIWSPSPVLSATKALELLLLALISAAIVLSSKQDWLYRSLALLSVLWIGILLLFNMMVYGNPLPMQGWESGRRVRLVLAYNHPLLSAHFVALSALAVVCSPFKVFYKIPLFGILVWLLVLTNARSSVLALLVALSVMGYASLPRRFRVFGVFLVLQLMLLLGVLIVWGVLDIGVAYEKLLSLFPDLPTLNGRTEVWLVALDVLKETGFFQGVGYYASRFYLVESVSWGAGQTHNAFVEVLLTTGIIGATLFAAWLVIALAVGVRGSAALAFLTYAIVTSIFNPTLFVPNVVMAFTLIYLLSARLGQVERV